MDIKALIFEAMKNRDQIRANILRLLLSESEKSGASYERVAAKLIESNNEVLSHRAEEKLVKENEILAEFIPKKISKDEIFSLLSSCSDDIMNGQEGKAIGFAMKFFKNKSLSVSGDDVKFVVSKLRESKSA